MLRALARGSLLVTIANLLPRAGAFLLLPIYARFLSQADFGTVSLAGSAALLLATVYRLGLDGALLRIHFDVEGDERRSLYATVAAMSLTAATTITLLAVIMAPLLARDAESRLVILLAVGIAAANAFQYVPSVWYRAREQTDRYLALAVAAFVAVVAVTLALVVFVRLGAIGSLIGQLAGAVVIACAAGAILWGQRPWRFRGDLARRSLDFGLPLLPHTLAGWLLNVSDRWLLGLLLGLSVTETLGAIGVYSLGYQLGYAVGLAAISFNAAWLPVLYRLAETPRAKTVLREATTVVIAGFSAMAAVIAVLAPDLVALIAPSDWAAAADVAAVVALASAMHAAGLMLASGLYLVRATRPMPLITLTAAVVSVGLNALLIPRLGVMGAAWSTLAAYTVLTVLIGVMARRRFAVPLDAGRLAMIAVIAAGSAIGSELLTASVEITPVFVHVAIAVTAVAALGTVAAAPLERLRLALSGTGAQAHPGEAVG
jgi:O-antigen/teichoic acid export membrane protein